MAKIQVGELAALVERNYPRPGQLRELAGVPGLPFGDLGRLARARQVLNQGNLGRVYAAQREFDQALQVGRLATAAGLVDKSGKLRR